MSARYKLTRVSEHRATPLIYGEGASSLTLRQCGQIVAWCARDNLGHSPKASTHYGMQAEACFKAGEGYRIGGYDFTVERV